MADRLPPFTGKRLRTPRSAAIAGIVFALLIGSAYILIRVSVPADPAADAAWLEDGADAVSIALGLVPIGGIAFLWFIGVIRDRIGSAEDLFFSTVLLGSGLLFLAMLFVSAGLAGGNLARYAADPVQALESGVYAYGREVTFQISSIYAIRMAGVFMISLGTIFIRTGTGPRWLALLTIGCALVLLLGVTYSLWLTMLFPGWVLFISLYILAVNLRREGDTGLIEAATIEE